MLLLSFDLCFFSRVDSNLGESKSGYTVPTAQQRQVLGVVWNEVLIMEQDEYWHVPTQSVLQRWELGSPVCQICQCARGEETTVLGCSATQTKV